MKQDIVTFNHRKVVNMYIVYEINKSNNISDYPTLENCLFGAVTLTKHADINKQIYSGYGIGFDRHGCFSSAEIGIGRNVIIFGAYMSLSTKIDSRKKRILYFKKFCLSLHYNGANSYLFVNGKEIHKFKAKDSEIVATLLCLGKISKDWTVDNLKKTGINGYVYNFSVDYDAIAVDVILDIHNYLMKKNDIV